MEPSARTTPLRTLPTVPTPEDNPDRRLVEQAAEGDLTAFRRIVERHAEEVPRTVATPLGPGPDADDARRACLEAWFARDPNRPPYVR